MAKVKRSPRRPRGKSTPPRRTVTTGPAAHLMTSVQQLLASNQQLVKENDRLKTLLARISGLASVTTSDASTRTARRRRAAASSASSTETVAPVKRPRKAASPETIEKRRQALARARAAKAEKAQAASA
jgi:hypothetical protein